MQLQQISQQTHSVNHQDHFGLISKLHGNFVHPILQYLV